MTLDALLENAAALTSEQAELLDRTLAVRGEEFNAFPLSAAQERLWLLDRLDPGNPAYDIAAAIDLRGAVARPALARALRRSVARHEALRTVFLEVRGRAFQWVRDDLRCRLPVVSLAALPRDRRQREAARLARGEARWRFALSRGPLLRTLLLELEPERHRLVLTLHHVVGDGWSSRILAREVAAHYHAAARGGAAELPALPLQYADYALWERDRLAGLKVRDRVAAAGRRLRDLPVLDLPVDRPRPPVRTLSGGRVELAPAAAVLAAFKRRCDELGVTLFAGLAATFAAVLARAGGQEEIALGAPSANRDRLEIEPLIGCFVNTLVLRLDLAGDPGGSDLLARGMRAATAAFADADLPFERIVEAARPERVLSHAPLVQAMVALQPHALDLRMEGLDARLLDVDNGTAKLDLTLALAECWDGLRGWIEYDAELFDRTTVRRLAGHWSVLLEALATDPGRRVFALPLLARAELHQVLHEWQGPPRGPVETTVHGLFVARAEAMPDAVALVWRDRAVTYGALRSWAARIAASVRRFEPGAGAPVGIFLDRSPAMVAAVLGVLEAGAAYLPLDPAYPEGRIAYTLEDARARAVVTSRGLRAALPEAVTPIEVADRDVRTAPLPPARVAEATTPSALAYVIYTSGSTGRPKGVAISHASATAMLRWAGEAFAPGELDGVLAATSLCFDLSVFELLAPLAHGGRVFLAADALALPELPGASRVTLVNTVPSAMAELVRLGLPSSVRTVNLAGEPLHRELVDRIVERRPGCRVLNLYGPSEDTTYSTWAEVAPGQAPPTIGRPVSGSRAFVLDPALRPVPAGVLGELCLAGAGLARGYLHRPRGTAEAFVPDPFSSPESPGGRLYRTGDLARLDPSGELLFQGRRDHQVKVRGFRVEPGEIEAALLERPGVSEAAVVARGEGAERTLVAYVASAEPVAPPELEAWLGARLPGYMVPSLVVMLPALPHTPNGKVDRKALPEPERPVVAREGPEALGGPVEDLLAGIWSEVLGVSGATPRSHFFDLGGNSLTAVRVLARAREVLGVDAPVRALFEAPTLGGLARRLAELRHGGDSGPDPGPVSLAAAARSGPCPAAPAQERLWFLDRLEPGDPSYHLPVALRLSGEVDLGALARALDGLVARHESLRTRLVPREGRPYQEIDPPAPVPLPTWDLERVPPGPRTAEGRRALRAFARPPFDLERGPVLRAGVVRLGPRELLLCLVFHHVTVDGWSVGLLLEEWAALYRRSSAGQAGGEPPLPAPSAQYPDYAAWQRSLLERDEPRLLAYWREALASLPPGLELPADRSRTPAGTRRGGLAPVPFPAPLADRLRSFGRREGASLFMLLLSALAGLLGRLTGERDLAIGSPAANRSRPELEGLVGLVVNTLVLRLRPLPEAGFRELVAQARTAALDAFAHAELPFERLVEELEPERLLARTPLFQVFLVVQNLPLPRPDLPGVAAELVPVDLEVAKFDLTLAALEEASGGLVARLEYAADLFDATTAARMARNLVTLLEAAVRDPLRPLGDLPLLSAAERHQVVEEWALPGATPGVARGLDELFRAQAAATPEAVALVAGRDCWSYRELALRAGRLAARLVREGVGPEVRVGVLLERGADLVVTLLAVLEAGGAYVPLDPAYPEERVRFMLRDAGARILVTEPHLAGALSGWAGRTLAPGGGADGLPAAAPPRPAGRLAYVIYTSGSTGVPKGVAIEHRSVLELVRWARDTFPSRDLEGVLAATSVCFDLSVFELFVPLVSGGRVILARDGLELPELPAAEGVRLVNTVPSVMAELVRSGRVPAGVRTVNLAGEPLTADLAEAVHRLPGIERLFNLYGPTEDTTYSTGARVDPGEPVTIGRPVAGSRVHVLDPRGRVAPAGTPGEICLGGRALARGYLGRPALTAERFVPDASSREPGARLYRTGDLGRFRPGGALDFLGRSDHQVKVRGFRVEPGEVEAALVRAPAVARAAVIHRRDLPAGPALVAYVVAEDGHECETEALRSHLAARLPAYMLPAAFVVLDALPLTPNGKLDRRALPAPAAVPPAGPASGGRTPAQELLAGLWAEVLGVEEVAADADFFALGGHSLLATRLVSRVREVLGVELPVRGVFEHRSLAAQATLVASLRAGDDSGPPLVSVPGPGPWPLSPSQERLWFLDRLDPGDPAYNVSGGLRLTGTLDPGELHRALVDLAGRHDSLRTRIVERGGEPLQEVMSEVPVALPVVDLGGLPGRRREAAAGRVLAACAGRGFDLLCAPLWRVLLVRLGAAEHRGIVVLHHVVADGWSLSLLVQELGELLRSRVVGEPAPARPPIAYSDYALWQRRRLAGPLAERQLGYWRGRLAGAPPYLDLPTDRPRTPRPGRRGRAVRLRLPADLARELRALGRREGASLFMVLLAAFRELLGRWSGQDDVVVGTPVAGRTRTECERVIGLFLNTLALRNDLGGEPTFRELLAREREAALGAYEHQDVPFEAVLEALRPERDLSRPPLFQVLYNMLNLPRVGVRIPGLALEDLALETTRSKFDLTLYAAEDGDGIDLDLAYATDLFDRETVVELLAQYRQLLELVASRPGERVRRLGPLARPGGVVPAEPVQPLRARWEGAAHERFVQTARRHPERIAVTEAGESWSYRELDRRSGWLATELRRLGVGPGAIVAVHAPRSAPLVAAAVGVLRAGAAFVLLDPAYPALRLVEQLRGVRPRAWVGLGTAADLPAELRDYLEAEGPTARLDLLEPPPVDAVAPLRPIVPAAGREEPAYVVFTSGSTGRPRAVLTPHGPLAHFLSWHAETHGLGSEDRFALLAGLAHDPVLRDLFSPLWTGGTLEVPREADLRDPDRLLAWLEERSVSVVHATPSLVRLLISAAGGAGRLRHLRYAFFGGEPLDGATVRRLRRFAPGLAAVSFYGATETPQGIAVRTVDGAGSDGPVPLGRGIEGVELRVTASGGRPAGVGELGEIRVRGPGLAVGYLGDARLTAERFRPDGASPDAGARTYLTGDLGRFWLDGDVRFVGRADGQVKVRGYRLELREVQAVAEGCPGIDAAAAVVRPDGAGEARLVLYVVSTRGPAVVEEVRRHLALRLPAAGVPGAVVCLDRLPLTPNGKLDAGALPAPDRDAGGAGRPLTTHLEHALAEVWRAVLGVEALTADSDFFALGGHSLSAVRLVARLRDDLGLGLSLRELFEARTLGALAEWLEVRPGARASAGLPRLEPAPPSERHEPFPLTDIQQAFWIGRQEGMDLGGVASHRYLEIDCPDLELERFVAAWRMLVERHDMLRAVVLPDGRQRVLPEVPPYEIGVEDLRGADAEARERRLAEVRAAMYHQVLDPERWPPFELRASRLGERRYRLHVSFDYLVADAWSFRVLLRELDRLYREPGAVLAPLGLGFRDCVLAEVAHRQSEAYRRSLGYWHARLATLPPAPELPRAHREPAERRFVRRSTRLDPAPWEALRRRAAHLGVSPPVVLLAAFSEALARWSAQARFTLVLTLFNRPPLHPDVDRVVGDFTSTVLLAVERGPGAGFGERARRLQRRLWQDLDHRHVSGVRVLRELAQAGGRGPRSPGAAMPIVFTSTLGLGGEDGAGPETELPGEVVFGVSQTPQVLLDHQISERAGTLWLTWDAVDAAFPPGMVGAMFEAYVRYVERLAADATAWDAAPRLALGGAELAAREAANATDAPVPPGTLHGPFLEQARRAPDRVAVVAPGLRLSFGELARRSGAVAAELRALGAYPDRPVAVVMEKGWEQVVAALGIVRAGAGYLPIDPSVPPARLCYLLDAARATFAIVQPAVDRRLEWPAGMRRVAVSGSVAEPTGGPTEPPPDAPGAGPEDLAYVIYTSGSTGAPKGVTIDHRGALNTVVDVNRRFGVGPEDRVLGLSSLSFDLSVYDLFGTLAAGAALVLPGAEAERDPGHWLGLLEAERVTVWNSVPALLDMLVTHAEGALRQPAVRWLLLSGDWIPLSLPERARKLFPGAGVVSLGGATEASIWSIFHPVEEILPEWSSIPYGRPLRNQTFQVLDRDMEPSPVWVPGDLFIGGIGLAKGYWHDPRRTAEAFVPDPGGGGRLYRTGDMGRYLPDGSLEFLGRLDTQVKVQGFRIELGEIEAALAQHPEVRVGVVVAVGEPRGTKRLVAYVVAERPRGPSQEALRDFLAARLPPYMVPARFVFLEALPLSANGKVDRKALPAPEPELPAAGPPGRLADGDPVEDAVAAVWAEALGAGPVRVTDGFFELGGDSLVATQVVSRLRRMFGVDLPLRALFDTPTIAGLAAAVSRALAGSRRDAPPPVEPASGDGPELLSFAQRRLWFLDRLEPGLTLYNLPVAVRMSGPLRVARLARCLRALVGRHEALRTALVERDGEPVQVVAPAGRLPLPVVDLSRLPVARWPPETLRTAADAGEVPFDLTAGRPIRSVLVRRGGEDHVLVLVMHHVSTDAWSMGIMVRELVAEYRRLGDPALPPVPAPLVRYRDVARWQREWLRGAVREELTRYWTDRLAGAPDVLPLWGGRPRPEGRTGRGAAVHERIPRAAADRLAELARAEGATLFMVLLAGFEVVLHGLSGVEDIVCGTDVANRNHLETEGVVGFFVNQLPLRVDLSGDPGFREILARCREACLGAYAHQDLPFDLLVEAARPDRDASHAPLFQVKLNLRNVPSPKLQVEELAMELVEVPRRTAQLDLLLSAVEWEDGLGLSLGYTTDLFDAASAAAVLEDFRRVLAHGAAEPAASLSELVDELRAEAERRRHAGHQERLQSRRRKLGAIQRKRVPVER